MNDRRAFLTGVGATVALATRAGEVRGASSNEAVAILGTGNLGKSLGKLWARNGHPIIYGSRTPDDPRVQAVVRDTGAQASATSPRAAVEKADLILFALPPKALPDLVPGLGKLDGKLVLDPMNDFRMVNGFPEPSPEVPTSVAEQLQALVPNAKVVKAFNTPSVKNIVDPRRLDGPFSIPLAGADAGAKTRVAALVSELGLEPVDVGPLIAARYLEAMMRLSFGYLVYSKGKSFEYYLRPVRA